MGVVSQLAGVDLNLVVALHALLEERSVTAAARRVGLSQPAMSHALGRLRVHFSDPLLVRSGRMMAPTVLALSLVEPLREVVRGLEALLGTADGQPSQQHTSVRLVTDDFIGVTVLPGFLAALRSAAPGVAVDVLQRGPPGRKRMLRRGLAELAAGDFSGAGMDLHRQAVGSVGWCCVLRADHPDAGGLTAARWAAAEHVIVSPTGGRRGVVDTALEAAGLGRAVPVAVPHFMTALAVVSRTALTCTLPSWLAGEALRLGLSVSAPPLSLPPLSLELRWHSRTEDDPFHRWFRARLVDAFASYAEEQSALTRGSSV
jgi:DNA-binding transcriptional LysR family regulator